MSQPAPTSPPPPPQQPAPMPPPMAWTQGISPGHVSFARRLGQAMKAKQLTRSQVAAAIWGTHESTIGGKTYTVARNRDRLSVYLSGKGYPRVDVLEKMAFTLNVRPEDLAPEVVMQARSKSPPPDVAITTLDHAPGERAMAALRVHTIVSSSLAIKIASLIEAEQAQQEKASDGQAA